MGRVYARRSLQPSHRTIARKRRPSLCQAGDFGAHGARFGPSEAQGSDELGGLTPPSRSVSAPGRPPAAAAWYRLLLAFVLLAGGFEATAQPPVTFYQLGVDDGLADGTVTSIAQDRQGFLWFGTREGLSRYDGTSLETFRHDAHDPSSISADHVTALWPGRDGELWIGTFEGGVDAYDPIRGDFRHYAPPAVEAEQSPPQITALLEDREGRVWAGTTMGLWSLDPNTGLWTAHRHDGDDPRSLGHDHVMALLEDPGDGLWVGTFGGGLDHQLPGGGYEHFVHDERDPKSLTSSLVQCLYRDSDGVLWVGTAGGGLDRALPDGGFERVARSEGEDNESGRDHIHGLAEDGAGNLWIATYGGGLERLDREGELTVFQHNPRNPKDPSSLPLNFLLALYRDRTGGIWMGTDGRGVTSFHANRDRFNHHFNDLVRADSLSHNTVWSFYEDAGGTLWIGTSGGLNRFDREAYRFTLVPDPEGSPRADAIWALYPTADGDLWLGTLSNGLRRVDPSRGRFEPPPRFDGLEGRGSPRIRAITGDGRDGLWLATQSNGLLHYAPESGEVVAHRLRDADEDSVLTALVRSTDGRLWLGTVSHGLARFDPESGAFETYRHDPDDAASLASDTVHGLILDDEGTLWVGTAAGLDRLRVSGKGFEHVHPSAAEASGTAVAADASG
ncbi:MAG: hypothetical protein KDD11_18790, partial [Acidobacteria bacterium]|nr:hypothetical protein [Acidobacteriota bacterium]